MNYDPSNVSKFDGDVYLRHSLAWSMSEKNKYYFLLHITVLIFGLTGILGKLISLNADVLVWYRLMIGVVGIIIYLKATGVSFTVPKKELINLCGVGLILAAHWFTFFEGIKQSNVSVALTCMSSSTLFTAILEPLYFKRRIKGYEVALGLVIIFAISLIFSIDFRYKVGIGLSLISAFLASWFTVINGKLINRVDAKRISLYQLGSAFIFVSIFLLFTVNNLSELSFSLDSDLIYLLILGLVCTSFAFMVSVEVMKKISPYTVSMTVNLEPIYSIILAIIIWPKSEIMPPLFYFAFVLIIGSIFTNAIMKRREGKVGVIID